MHGPFDHLHACICCEDGAQQPPNSRLRIMVAALLVCSSLLSLDFLTWSHATVLDE